ncbi:MAG: hypothetical protein ACR652_09185 [Methylocystis sp.]|uniref:hypothetical protein n=1 Tax=Methylocystis sp. TaxID=1911079 RepID=UPI003DA251C9
MGKRSADASDDENHSLAEAAKPDDGAVELIHEVAKAVRNREGHATHLVSELERILKALCERLASAEARARDADAAHRQAMAEVDALDAELRKAQARLSQLKDLVAGKEKDLGAMNGRAAGAERRFVETGAVLSILIDEIRDKLKRPKAS